MNEFFAGLWLGAMVMGIAMSLMYDSFRNDAKAAGVYCYSATDGSGYFSRDCATEAAQ